MQKKIIVAAVAAALAAPVAMADTAVTISGNLFIGYSNNKNSGPGTAGFGTVSQIQDQSSAIIFKVQEDLGGGMYAHLQIDTRYGPDQAGATWSGGNTGGGLGGGWGKFTMGKWDLHYSEFAGNLGAPRARSLQALLGHGIMSEVNGRAITPRTRAQNVFMYETPNMGGFGGKVTWTPQAFGAEGGQAANGSKGDAWNIVLKYANGPINVGGSYWRHNEEGGNGAGGSVSNERSSRLWFKYTLPMGLELGLGWDRSQYDSDATAGTNWIKRTAWMLPVAYTMGPHKMYFQYARAGNTSGAAVNDSTGATAYLLGYDYALSKRTTLGAYYTTVRNKSNGTYDFFATSVATGADMDSRQIYLGMGHSF